MRQWVACAVIVVACGKGKTDQPAPSKSQGPAGAAPTKASVTGTVTLGGALAGTFAWKDDLAITCTWVPDLKVGGADVTMTDGSAFIALSVHINNQHEANLTLTSGKLHADPYVATSGFTLTGSDDKTHISAAIDTTAKFKDAAETIQAKLEFSCPPW